MSHVDEGTLHAYLDGELAPVERERVDTHLKGCPACQARLAEERAILERASRLLGMATPPERAMPPLTQLRRPPVIWRLRRPLAWAATLILAVGLGWYARGFRARAVADSVVFDSQPAALATADHTAPPAARSNANRMEQKDEASRDRERMGSRRLAPAESDAVAPLNALAMRQRASGALQRDSSRPDTAKLDDVATLGRNAPAAVYGGAGISIRGSRPPAAQAGPPPATPEPQAKAAAAPVTMGEASSGVVVIDGALVRPKRAAVILSSEWPLIARQPAKDVLGVEPVVIPGFAVRAYRRNPAAREIVVEQVTDAGTKIA
ncbi:MAG TPA: anti-sigma factor, partial [Gemmatimonadales bacterium]|nr:anti-sigma factor [Gemmatimonadales bacterium]